MSRNGTKPKVVNIDDLIDRAITEAARIEGTRHQPSVEARSTQTAVVDSAPLLEENETLKKQLQKAEQELTELKRASGFVSNNPKYVELVEKLLGSEFFAQHLIAGNGELVDLQSLSRRLDDFQQASCAGASTSVLPATPPVAARPGPTSAASSDTNGKKPSRFKKYGQILIGTPKSTHQQEKGR